MSKVHASFFFFSSSSSTSSSLSSSSHMHGFISLSGVLMFSLYVCLLLFADACIFWGMSTLHVVNSCMSDVQTKSLRLCIHAIYQ